MAEEDGGGTTGITTLEALKNAILSAQEGAEITLADDITGANAEEGSAITIDKALTLDGANHTISGTAAQNIIVITKAGVILKNVTIINTAAVAPVAGTGYNDVTVFQTGIDTETTLEDVTLQGNGGIGLVVNGSKVKIKNVNASNHVWGSVNLQANGNVAPALTVEGDGKLAGLMQIYADPGQSPNQNWVTASGYTYYSPYASGLWTNKIGSDGSYLVDNASELQAVIGFINASEAPSPFSTIKLAAGDYELSSQLVINKAITLEGTSAEDGPATKIKAKGDATWPKANKDKNLITIVAGNAANVTLKNIRVQDSKAAGINVQTANLVKLENVACENNTTAGLLVHAPVEATNFHTGENDWGGVNIDNGNNGESDKNDYNPTFKFDANSTFAEPKQIWSELADKEATAIVTLPEGNTTWRAIKGKSDDGTKDMWFWTNQKMTQESVTSFFMDKAVSGNYKLVYANGNPITIEQGKTADEVVISVDNTDESIALKASDNIIVFGGAKDANVSSTNITMKGGKIAKLIGGCYYGNVENVTLNISGGEISEHLIAGGYGPANVQSTVTNKSANVTTKSTVTITDTGQSHTKIGYTVTTGLGYSKVKEIYTSISNATLGWVIGGFAPVGIGQTIDTDFDNNVNTVENASLILLSIARLIMAYA